METNTGTTMGNNQRYTGGLYLLLKYIAICSHKMFQPKPFSAVSCSQFNIKILVQYKYIHHPRMSARWSSYSGCCHLWPHYRAGVLLTGHRRQWQGHTRGIHTVTNIDWALPMSSCTDCDQLHPTSIPQIECFIWFESLMIVAKFWEELDNEIIPAPSQQQQDWTLNECIPRTAICEDTLHSEAPYGHN